MKKTASEIISQIRLLLNELESASEEIPNVAKKAGKINRNKANSCIGALQGLIAEGFFDEPKTRSKIMDKLKKQGQTSFTEESVSMNLLNLVKPPRQILERDGTPKHWVYFKRK